MATSYLEALLKADDSIEMTVPLFLRLMEYAREGATDDIVLHRIAERAVKANGVLDIESYSELVPEDKKNK